MKISTGIGVPYSHGGSRYKMLFTSTGDGTGVSTISLTVSKDIGLTLDGTARFYSDSAGTLDESTTWTVTAGATRTYYLKCPSGTANLTFSDRTKLTQWNAWTSSTNAASLSGDISKFVNLTYISIYGSNTLSGNISGLTSLIHLGIASSATIFGSIEGLTSLIFLQLVGFNTITGDINPIVNGITYLIIKGNNHMDTYTSGATWTNATVTINPYTGYGYSSTEIDNMLIDMDNSGFNNVTITLQGSSAARTAASDAAVNNMTANSCTIITN